MWHLIAGTLLGSSILPGTTQATSATVQVMVLGSWHFANHNLDLHNVVSEDVRSDRRQYELRRVADALEEFKPTMVVVEKVAPRADLLDPDFAAFTAGMLRSERSERVQLGYRVARSLGHKNVYAINEQPSEGEPDYFPYGKVQEYAESHGQRAFLDDLNERTSAGAKDFDKQQPDSSIAELLMKMNGPSFFGGNAAYYAMLRIGDTERQPGAELNAMWYLRNAKIFAKLMTVAKPGERVLIVYGAGHAYWLRHFASETPGFTNVDPMPFLHRAAESR